MAVYSINKISLTWIPLSDGTKLAATLWIPTPKENKAVKTDEKFPAILEFLAYRRTDHAAQRDEMIHSYFCCRGYVGVRADIRGTGDSEGLYYDEYEKQEQDDCCDVISWISQQPWCSGAVGMCGMSWGGFNSLQVAARQPSALKAVISICSSDNRYSDDVHYRGGCVMGHGMLSWSNIMSLRNVLPPSPRDEKQWMDVWLERLRNLSPWVHKWLSHQTRDKYWEHGSICEDYSKVKCPVFLAGGWADLYTNTIFRMAEHLRGPVKALVGPWTHGWPMEAVPGPQIDFLSECVRWWDFHLKGLPNGIMKEPKLRIYLRDGVTNPQNKTVWPGSWIAEDSWPSLNVHRVDFILQPRGQLRRVRQEKDSIVEPSGKSPEDPEIKYCQVKSSLLCGQASDTGMPSTIGGVAVDQRLDDGLSVCFQTPPIDSQLALLGFPEVTLDLSADFPGGILVARLCDVFPDGRSTLICKGILNLSHRDGDSPDSVKPLEPHKAYRVRLQLDSAAYVVAAGHKIRLAISSNYWPTVWPSPFPTCLTIIHGNENVLSLPVRAVSESGLERDKALRRFDPPCKTRTLPVEWIRKAGSTERTLEMEPRSGTYRSTYFKDFGSVFLKDSGTLYERTAKEVYTVIEDEPTSARVTIEGQVKLKRDASADRKNPIASPVWDTSAQTLSEMWADDEKFYVRSTLKVFHQTEEVFSKAWHESFERSFV